MSKKGIKQWYRLEGSMVEAYLTRETTHFGSYYFQSDVLCLRNRDNRPDDGGETNPFGRPLSIFNQPGKGSKKRTRRGLNALEFNSASTHVLLNCPQVKSFLE